MRVLGVDGSLTCTGLAVVDHREAGLTDRLLATGTIRTRPEDGPDASRYAMIARGVVAVARQYCVDLVAVEMPYVDTSKSPKVALQLAGLRGAVEAALSNAGLQWVSVAPSSRLKAVGIRGRLERPEIKRRVVALVRDRFGVMVGDDEADAYAVAKAGLTKWREAQRKAEQLSLGIKAGRKVRKPRRKNRPSDL